MLWLASHAADLKFVHQEGQKLAKLVEAQTSDRPVPVVSFVARQRDLSELIGESVPGAERVNFSDALKHWEGRFHTITLEDRNLPAIAEKRVLRCKSEAARQELVAAFEQTAKVRESVMNVLLTSDGDKDMFRKVYPFSPALVQTLFAVSSVLQRERTALKVMMQLLVDHRDVLKVGDLVPVGDLFDVIAHGDEAFSQEMAVHFENAKRLYHQKLLPIPEAQHGRREDVEQLGYEDPKRTAFRNDDRLIKSLLLSALVPEVESLRGLNAERLAALNHGTIRTPIPGREGQEVLRRVKTWAGTAGEIRIGDETNPTISVQLSGVDTEGIIEQARSIDNQGNRIRRVREMLFEQLGVEDTNEFFLSHEFRWRNTRRSCEVLFKNVRELPDSSLDNSGDDWKLVIDYPFDEGNHTPRDDLSQLERFLERQPEGAKTICWVPTFFSDDAKKDLGMLVILDHILSGERFTQYANHLSPQDRQAAKSLLENQRSVLRQRVQNHLEAAYGLDTPGSLDTTHELELSERFRSLMPGFEPKPPVAANLKGAMLHLLDQSLAHEFPAAPEFGAEIKPSALKKVYEVVSAATQARDGREAVDRPLRPLLRQIANPLRLGEMGPDATHFVLGQHWKTHFTRKGAETGAAMTVTQLRQWLDDPKPMGLPKETANLVILVFAEQTNRTFYLHGAPFDALITQLPDACELREHKLPSEEDWTLALERAGSILGVAVSPLLNVSNVSQLQAAVKKEVKGAAAECRAYATHLRRRLEGFGLDADSADRLTTAAATAALVEKLAAASEDKVVELLAKAEVATSTSAMGDCARNAAALRQQLESTNWEIFDALARLTDERKQQARKIHDEVYEALQSDEHAIGLAAALRGAQSKAVRLLTEVEPAAPAPPSPPKPESSSEPTPQTGRTVVSQGSERFDSLDQAARKIEFLRAEANGTAQARLTISWVIEKEERS